MKKSLIFLVIALLLGFVMIPSYEMFFGDLSFSEVLAQIEANLAFDSYAIWKRVFIFYLALWCGNAIIWALKMGPINPPTN